MLQRILVPLDGSARAEQAIPVAARLARASGGSVVFVEVANIHLEYGTYLGAPATSPIDRDYEDAVAYVKSIAARADLAGIATETEVLAGSVAETILNAVESHNADAIVMNSHGRSGFTGWVLGSVAQKVSRHSAVPVLVLRDAGPVPIAPIAGTAKALRVLVPLDGSPLAEAVLQPASEFLSVLAAPAQGEMELLRVLDVPAPRALTGAFAAAENVDSTRQDSVHAEAHGYLAQVADRLRRHMTANQRFSVTTTVAFAVDAAEGIIDIAEGRGDAQYRRATTPADIIAVATHGRGGFARWALGSVTERVLQGTKLPVLVVRPPEAARAEQEAAAESVVPSPLPLSTPLY